MKTLRYMVAGLAMCAAFAACQPEPTDIFSTSPVAPELSAHNDILITDATLGESVTFTWSKARNMELQCYEVHMIHEQDTLVLASQVSETSYTISKKDFNDFLREEFAIEPMTTSRLSAFVAAGTAEKVYFSNTISFNVFSCGDAVAPVIRQSQKALNLNMATPDSLITVLSWEPARLGLNVNPKYKVTISVEGGSEVTLGSNIEGTSYDATTDAINEAAVSAGASETEATEMLLKVYACSETIELPSESVKTSVTAYVATFADAVTLPGSYQSWAPATAPSLKVSKVVKGLYEGVVDLTTSDGTDCEFKFCEGNSWDSKNYGFDSLNLNENGGKFNSYSSNAESGSNIKVHSGLYFISLDQKHKTLEMVQINTLNLIGAFCDWNGATERTLEYDAASNSFACELEITEATAGSEYKVRFNQDWTYSFGVVTVGETTYFGYKGGNDKLPSKAGNYKVVLSFAGNPAKLSFVDLNMPDELVLAGDYSGHSWNGTSDVKVYLVNADNGSYKGYVTMMNMTYGFKVVKNGNIWIGSTGGDLASGLSLDETGGNMMAENGSYYIEVDMINMTLKGVTLTTVGIIGDFNSWGGDAAMTYDESSMTYKITQEFASAGKFKFRFNGDWAYNLGGDLNALRHDGANIEITEAGTYDIVLDMHNTPTATITKK